MFDVLKGAADIELSRSPETLTAGPSAGEFVDEAASEFAILYMRNPRDGVAPWESPIPLNSGQYYWHVRLRDDSVDSDGDGFMEGTQYPWGPVRTLTVSDEPPVFEGWIIRVQLLRPVGRCKTRLRVYGTISWSDNEEEPSATYSVSLKAGARVLGRVRGTFDTTFRPRFDGAICSTRRVTARSLTATAALRDTSEQLVIGDPRKVRNPAR
ncbi:hypothetical protein [Candidatus Solirubrobacter pratensis]|uniref:hypothetical protein n=1 Tax=Candidatus Solirubrobacter pratensis TaxID=1298857 RepID=UPI0012DCEEBB|nr:hypothetical protein [Candidatus Solirubrobacter pratensis]